ncbi:acyl-CoA/acyl-ACP dehydrogenase [Candidatus Bathyarchaeota archaeon]|nr:acyl-CoA/acyl-ACP dehydrogenase [Candidatus Bathyarchaeota archaeon]MBS7630315.1 acyl-CoA/acyl-ACP dehydrogenase [Candidatus Bathyarchaeota archaeon]
MDFSFTDEQNLFRESVREWLAKNLPIEKVRENDEKHKIPKDIIKGLGDLDLLCMTLPEEHGGAGADWVTTAIAAEELGYADISVAIPVFFLVQASWGYVVDEYCTDVVRDICLRKAAKGESFIGIGVTEPGGGSDVAGFKTMLKKEKDGWLINGEKTYISGTEECKEMGGGYFVSGFSDKSQGHRGMTAFYMPINAPGVEVTKRFENMGRMAISTGGFKMTNVHIPDEYQLGETGRGFYLTMEGFDAARVLVSSSCIGAAQRALELGIEYIKERRAFEQPLAKFQGIQFDLAEMAAEHEAIKSLIYRTAWMLDKKYKEGTFTALECSKYISMCKLLAPHHALDVLKRTMLWFGAYGYSKECPLEMGLRGIMSYCIGAEGASNIQKIVISRETLGRDWTRTR